MSVVHLCNLCVRLCVCAGWTVQFQTKHLERSSRSGKRIIGNTLTSRENRPAFSGLTESARCPVLRAHVQGVNKLRTLGELDDVSRRASYPKSSYLQFIHTALGTHYCSLSYWPGEPFHLNASPGQQLRATVRTSEFFSVPRETDL